uniref:Gustatory receptor n=2 Tax=Anopheles albimanus TaxID=7167 RepID=A0A182FRY2_ANOAL
MSPPLKYWFNINSFYEASRPCFRLQKFFGLLPFTVYRVPAINLGNPPQAGNHSSNSSTAIGLWKSEVKFMDVVIFTLWQIFFLQMFYAQWPTAFLEVPMSRIITLVSLLLHLLGGISCSSSAMVAFHCRRKFVRMLQLVDDADSLFKTFFSEIPHQSVHCYTVTLHGVTFLCNFLLIIVDYIIGTFFDKGNKPNPLMYLFIYYYIIRTIQVTAVSSFIAGLYNFHKRLEAIKQQIRSLFVDQTCTSLSRPCFGNKERIQALTEAYCLVCESLQMFCALFVWQPMFSCASLITAAVFAIITVCHTLSNESPILLILSIVYTIPAILYTFHFLLIVKLGHDLKNEGKQIAVLVHKAINQSSATPVIVERLMIFSRYLQHQTPVVSCGLFNFDWTLALSLISALATYSVILIQFELVVPQFFISAIVQLFEERNNSTEP